MLRNATPAIVAEALGLAYRGTGRDVDLVVVGAGPAGLAAAVYGASEGLVTVLLDAAVPGGQAGTKSRIENYLGFPQGVSGDALARLAMVQALKFGTQIYTPCPVAGLEVTDGGPVAPPRGRHRDPRPRHDRRDRGALPTARRPGWDEFEAAGCVHYSATELDIRGYESQPVAGDRRCELGRTGGAVPRLPRVARRPGRARRRHPATCRPTSSTGWRPTRWCDPHRRATCSR